MQDNLHEDLFADHAWSEMRKVLDREMPERKRRGAFWLWFLPALGLCVLLGQDTAINHQLPVATEKTTRNNQVIAQNNTVKQIDQSPENKQDAHSVNALNEPLAPNEAVANQRIHTPSDVQQTYGAKKRSPSTTTALIVKEANSGLSVMGNAGEKNSNQGEIITVAENSIETKPNPEQTNSVPEDEQVEKVEAFETIDSRNMDLPTPEKEIETVKTYHQPVKKRLEWWALAGTQLANGTNGLSGYQAGVALAKPLGEIKLFAGLTFEQTRVGFQSIQRDSLTGKESYSGVKVISPADPNLTTISAGRTGGVNVSNIQLKFISLYLSAQYALGGKLALSAGGNLHYLSSVKLGDTYIREALFNNSRQAADAMVSNGNIPIPASEGISLSTENFRSFGFSAQIGLHYQVLPRWNIMLNYRRSLQQFTTLDNLLLKPQWLDFGVRYRIK